MEKNVLKRNLKDIHPAKLAPSRWFFHDRSDQPESIQIIDLLHDIRLLLVVIAIILVI